MGAVGVGLATAVAGFFVFSLLPPLWGGILIFIGVVLLIMGLMGNK